ncbi:MAG: hypothetical protein NZ699_13760 [Roseiflexus sp.]|nr:hypothetical protein [Roseiflexus sp.]MCS7290191.1 hypothetical protein [Roseiflexus sp.]MDW8148803.1 hypothetical protein [Roseiflexaceae bacterium]
MIDIWRPIDYFLDKHAFRRAAPPASVRGRTSPERPVLLTLSVTSVQRQDAPHYTSEGDIDV